MKCGNCGREAKDNETFCSNCGLRLTGKNNTRKIGIIIGIIIAVAGIMMAIVISNSIVNNQRVTTLYDKASSDFMMKWTMKSIYPITQSEKLKKS